MKVPLTPKCELKVSTIKPRVYLLGNEVCQLVDETFDKMHCLGRLKFNKAYTFFSFPVFII